MDPHVHHSVSVMRLLLTPPRSHLSPTITSRLHQPLRHTHNPLHSTISNPLKLLHLRSLHLHIIHRNLLQHLRNLRIQLLPKGKFMLNNLSSHLWCCKTPYQTKG